MSARAGLDWSWALDSGGALSWRQRLELLAPLLRLSTALPAMHLRIALGRRGHGAIDLDAHRWPDSGLAHAAESEARDLLSPQMLYHSYRTYFFGLVLAAIDGVRVDSELVYVSCLLHAINIERPTPGRCYAVTGSEYAQALALDHGADLIRAARIGAAIAGHLTLGAAENLSHPAGFVSAGALCDVIGRRLQETDPAWVEALLRRYPRTGFQRHLLDCVATESHSVPRGRVHMLRYLFPLLARAAPLSESYSPRDLEEPIALTQMTEPR